MTAPSAERCPQKGVKCSCLQRDQYLAVIKANTSTGACGVPRHMLGSPVCRAVPTSGGSGVRGWLSTGPLRPLTARQVLGLLPCETQKRQPGAHALCSCAHVPVCLG